VEYTGTELDAMELAQNYHRWIVDTFRPYIRGTVVEIGAGIGTISELLAECSLDMLYCFEPAKNLFPRLDRRMSARANVRVLNSMIDGQVRADAVVLINVLEHIKDDLGMLRHIHRTLSGDGRLLLFVPALPMLMGALDEQFGHIRRYTRKNLAQRVLSCGFEISLLRYANFPGIFAWYLASRVLKKKTITARAARFYDSNVVPFARAMEGHVAPPIGQSLVLIAKKG
jgi:SAM-dependent methyltransferase